MNWESIKNKYPLAWRQLLVIYDVTGERELTFRKDTGALGWWEEDDLADYIWRWWDTRWLYDFFDEHKIIIETFWRFPGFECTVWDGPHIEYLSKRDSRPEAEEEAFKTAFSVLELHLAPETTITTKALEEADETIIKTAPHPHYKGKSPMDSDNYEN